MVSVLAEPRWRSARIVLRGGGDLASGVAYRLHRAGFPVIILELPRPLFVRRTVCFGEAVFAGTTTVEGITARLTDQDGVAAVLDAGEIPVLIDPEGRSLPALAPAALIDARMEKRPLDTHIDAAPVVIALGPGFTAGVDCHVVIETNRGHFLGRAYYSGSAEPDTGEPGVIGGQSFSRVLRAPAEGFIEAQAAIGDPIAQGQVIAVVGGHPVTAAFHGVLRGLLHPSVPVMRGMKIGDLDPRAARAHCFTISEKSLAVGGGVLEALLSFETLRERLC
jgi:xanthine dehydrogenase accessory factor